MKNIYFTITFCFFATLSQAQIQKPIFKPAPSKTSQGITKQPITTSIKGIPSARRQLINPFTPKTQPVLKRGLVNKLGLRIVETAQSGRPIMIKGELKQGTNGRDVSIQAFDYLEAIKTPLQIKNPAAEFKIIDRKTDELGQTHIKLQQEYKGIKIYGGQVWLHAKAQQVDMFNGRNYATPKIDNIHPTLSKETATDIANKAVSKITKVKTLSELEKQLLGDRIAPELVIYHPTQSTIPHLAWHLHLYPNISNQWEYFIDAHSGEVLDAYKTLCQLHYMHNDAANHTCTHEYATNLSNVEHNLKASQPNMDGPTTSTAIDLKNSSQIVNAYELSGNFFLIDASRPMFNDFRSNLPNDPVGAIWTIDAQNTYPGNDDFDAIQLVNGDNVWDDQISVSAHTNAGIAYEYFRTTFNRNSINGEGGTIISLINVSDEDGSSLENAFWSGQAMFYGNGGNVFLPLARSLDVAAHEMSHGVIQNTANLRYQGESGAINESYADIFGVLVDREDWQLGEDVVNPNVFRTGALRDLENPNNGGTRLGDPGYQPDNVADQFFGREDNGGVHINSGIVNRAFFLIASTIGRESAEQIYYRALTTYLVNTSQFIDLRTSILQSATDLFGQNSNEMAVIANAFDQVGIFGSDIGQGDQSGGETEVEVEANPGNDFIVFTDNDQANIYVADGAGNILIVLSNSGVLSRPSITDDGSLIVFVGQDRTIHLIRIDWSQGGVFTEEIIQPQPIWRNAAISRNGDLIAALEFERNNFMDIFDLNAEDLKTFELFNPTFTEGINTGEVQFADVMEFDFTGQFVMYDALNIIQGEFGGEQISYWDIGFIKVFDNNTNTFEVNVNDNILKLFSGIPQNVSIANPTFSKNSPNIIAYEYIDEFDTTPNGQQVVEMRGLNLATNDETTLFRSLILHTPSYSRLDDRIIFNAEIDNNIGIAEIALAEDKITSLTGDAFALVQQPEGAKLGVWFSDGSRQLTSINELEKSVLNLQLTPNPFVNELSIQFTLDQKEELEIALFNTLGQQLQVVEIDAWKGLNVHRLETSKLPSGHYFISISSDKGIITKKIVK